ncbi:MAG TPA: PepSY domain-containing protein [Phycisphaerae bacterium]|jgi:uncharacterized membrane protein YkoI|nr:hypothetical protein [Phycisphaerae bacterium]HPP19858.1 PepSY domain-containing protein [Phycisphaerae bacterium]HPU31216.1 PepSY domain-containing protein [Phycisphaerae bacterium]
MLTHTCAIVRGSLLLFLCFGFLASQPGCHTSTRRPEPIARTIPPATTAPDSGRHPHRVGIIVDIDETISITDYPTLVFGIGTDRSRPIEHALGVLTRISQDFDIAYLTARPQWLTGHTRRWLTEKGFPDGIVLTTARVVDVCWPGSFKQRSVAALRHHSPHLLIGIGDRPTDVEAYVANGMLPLVVNPRRHVTYDERAVLLKDWQHVGDFFEQNAEVLRDPDSLRARYGVGGDPLDPASVRTRPEIDLSLLVEVPLLGPALLVEAIAKAKLAHEQAEARRAMEQVSMPLVEALRKVIDRFGEDKLLELRLATKNRNPVYIVTYAQDGKIYETVLDASLENASRPRRIYYSVDDPLQARTLARLSFFEALARAQKEVLAEPYEIELEMDSGRATYEIALMGLGRFLEIEIDAQTGEVIEVEDETAAR